MTLVLTGLIFLVGVGFVVHEANREIDRYAKERRKR